MGDRPGYRWVVLGVGTFAQAATALYFLGLAAVTPALREDFGLSLAGVGALIGVISVGLITSLIAWGAAADRFGERGVMTAGLVGAAVALGAADAGGIPAVFVMLAVTCLVAAAAVTTWIREPPGPRTTGRKPVAGLGSVLTDRRLRRLSLAGLLLVVPQVLGSVFLVELLADGAGVSLAVAGWLLALTQVLGAVGRLGNGFWSDRIGSRLGPLRVVAVAVTIGFGLSALLEPGPAPLLAAVLVPAAALAISWNGLVFTAAGELAPPGRAATAMAVSNTANYAGAAVAPPLGGLVAQTAGGRRCSRWARSPRSAP